MNNDYTHTGYFERPAPPTPTTDKVVLIKEQYYTRVYLGKGDLTASILEPRVGDYYINATTGNASAYNGSAWAPLGQGEVIRI